MPKVPKDHQFFRSLVADLADPNTHIADEGTQSAEFTGTIDTGSYLLNAALSGSIFGGVPNNKITAFAGDPATGKTFFVLGIVKRFLDDHPQGCCFYYDTEAAVTRQMMVERGVDAKRVGIVEPDTIQTFRTHALKVLEKYEAVEKEDRQPVLLVLDSLGQLSTTKEVSDTGEGKETRDMTKAQLIKATFRVLSLKLAKLSVPLLVTNHIYDKIGIVYGNPKEMGGGQGLKYAASQIVFLTKAKERDNGQVVGNLITCTMVKSRFTKENTKVTVQLRYDKGLDRYYGLLELAERFGLVKKAGHRYEFPGGEKAFAKEIAANPEGYFTKDFLDRLDQEAAKAFSYGTAASPALTTAAEDSAEGPAGEDE